MSIELPDDGAKPELFRDPMFRVSYAIAACLLAAVVVYLLFLR